MWSEITQQNMSIQVFPLFLWWMSEPKLTGPQLSYILTT
jgi:hypothetical protein